MTENNAHAPLSFERQAYEIPELWVPGALGAEHQERVECLAHFITANTTSLLDVGCGNGLFLNYLFRTYPNRFEKLFGIDRSHEALKWVQTEKAWGSIEALPFADRTFHTVSCTEVLEHLTVDIYPRAILEIARVADKNILICVPHDQNLRASLCECPNCMAHINPDFHLRSFSEERMRSLFEQSGFQAVKIAHISKVEIRWDQILRNWVKSGFRINPLLPWPGNTICPACGFSDRRPIETSQQPSSVLKKLAKAIFPRRSRSRWIAVYYNRMTD